MKKKVIRILSIMSLICVLSISNVFAMHTAHVLSQTSEARTILFNKQLYYREYYTDINFRNGYNVSTDTKTYSDGTVKYIDVYYRYSLY